MIIEWFICTFYVYWKAFIMWFSNIMLATKPPRVRAEQIRGMLSTIKPGDIICRGNLYYLDRYFIPEEYTHSGIVVGKDKMIHVVGTGIGYIDPINFIKDSDNFIILRPINYDIEALIDSAIDYERRGIEYDFAFNDPSKFYCHEFVCQCLSECGDKPLMYEKSFLWGPLKVKRKLYLYESIKNVSGIVYKF